MRIKAVLRDNEILALEAGSKERIIATSMKNLDRIIGQSSLLKVIGLGAEDRITLLEVLGTTKIHVWLGKDAQQDIIYLTQDRLPEELQSFGYQWQ
ncbi:MAG: hypothetical protein ACFFED_06740 [Candidatus Thorarchaeota archaeon]